MIKTKCFELFLILKLAKKVIVGLFMIICNFFIYKI